MCLLGIEQSGQKKISTSVYTYAHSCESNFWLLHVEICGKNFVRLKYNFSLFCSVSPSENSDDVCNPSRSERLILEELTQPSCLGLLKYPPYKKVCKTSGSTDYQKKTRDKVIIFIPL